MPLEELKALLRYKNISYRELANELNRSTSTICLKINRKAGYEFTSSEIIKAAEFLELDHRDVVRYFLPELVAPYAS